VDGRAIFATLLFEGPGRDGSSSTRVASTNGSPIGRFDLKDQKKARGAWKMGSAKSFFDYRLISKREGSGIFSPNLKAGGGAPLFCAFTKIVELARSGLLARCDFFRRSGETSQLLVAIRIQGHRYSWAELDRRVISVASAEALRLKDSPPFRKVE